MLKAAQSKGRPEGLSVNDPAPGLVDLERGVSECASAGEQRRALANDFGGAVAPLLVAGITAVASLSLASGVMGVLGLLGAVILRVYVPKYSKRP